MTYVIHRYPVHLIDVVHLAGGERLTIRPVLPQDADILQAYVRGLSQESRYMRFMRGLRELSPGMLGELTSVDYTAHMALLATWIPEGEEQIVAEAHYVAAEDDPAACEFALSVADAWQRKGLGRLLLDRMSRDAAAAGFRSVVGHTLRENRHMQALARKMGLAVDRGGSGDPLILRLVKPLDARPDATRPMQEAFTNA